MAPPSIPIDRTFAEGARGVNRPRPGNAADIIRRDATARSPRGGGLIGSRAPGSEHLSGLLDVRPPGASGERYGRGPGRVGGATWRPCRDPPPEAARGVASVYGILKAGAVYVPLDHLTPAPYVAAVSSDIEAGVVGAGPVGQSRTLRPSVGAHQRWPGLEGGRLDDRCSSSITRSCARPPRFLN